MSKFSKKRFQEAKRSKLKIFVATSGQSNYLVNNPLDSTEDRTTSSQTTQPRPSCYQAECLAYLWFLPPKDFVDPPAANRTVKPLYVHAFFSRFCGPSSCQTTFTFLGLGWTIWLLNGQAPSKIHITVTFWGLGYIYPLTFNGHPFLPHTNKTLL